MYLKENPFVPSKEEVCKYLLKGTFVFIGVFEYDYEIVFRNSQFTFWMIFVHIGAEAGGWAVYIPQ